MLLVDRKQRIRAPELKEKMDELKKLCECAGFCLQQAPREAAFWEGQTLKQRPNGDALAWLRRPSNIQPGLV